MKIALASFAIFLHNPHRVRLFRSVRGIMRYIFSFIFVFCFVQITVAEPYTAVITADGVAVRSGPGVEFYPTLQLQTGDKVEVFYEQGEWCAIRPPIGSFSWVSAKFVEFGSGNIGTVLANGLASRIGSDDSDDCDTVQVTLKQGEAVFILDRRETPENSGSPVWLKIAPPNGEFRWIHRSAFSSREPEIVSPTIRQVQHVEAPPLPKVASAHPFAATQSVARSSMIDSFQRAFNELQRESYIVMTRPTDDEVFGVLIQRASELHQVAETDRDLERTYHLLESLQRTRAVRRELALRRPATTALNPKSVTNSGTPPPQQLVTQAYTLTSSQSLNREPGTVSLSGVPSPTLRAGVNVGGYDIVGRLGEFDPLPPGHPPYAVVDESGKIICLISPSANLDLSQHIGQFVGINGILGFWDAKQSGKPLARHITARHAQTLR